MPQAQWFEIPRVTNHYEFLITIENREPVELMQLGILFTAIGKTLEATSGRLIAGQTELRNILQTNGFKPFDAALCLALRDVEHGSWKFWLTVGGTVATGLVASWLANNVDRVFQTWGVDAVRYVSNPVGGQNLLPFERNCDKAIEAAIKLSANKLSCRITGPNGFVQEVLLLGPSTPRR